MKANLGTADKITRLIIAAIIAVLFFTGTVTGILSVALMVLAGILILTSLVNFCPLYILFGISTCKKIA